MSEKDNSELVMLKALCATDPIVRDNFPSDTKSELLAKYLFTELAKYASPLGIDLFAILKVPIILSSIMVDVLKKAGKEKAGKYQKETEQTMAKIADEILKGLENKDEEGDSNASKDNS